MVLSPELEREVEQEIEAFEKAKRMKYITNMERRGLEKGLEKGPTRRPTRWQIRSHEESVLAVLETRLEKFPMPSGKRSPPRTTWPLKRWHRLGIQLASLAEFETRIHKRGIPDRRAGEAHFPKNSRHWGTKPF